MELMIRIGLERCKRVKKVVRDGAKPERGAITLKASISDTSRIESLPKIEGLTKNRILGHPKSWTT